MIPNLSESDLQKPRIQADLRAWVDALHAQFVSTEEGKRAVRLNSGNLVKVFEEEVWPLALFADGFYKGRADILFQLVLGCESYDALLLDASERRPRKYLQITQAIDGNQNHIRMLHLNMYGRAPLTGPKLLKNEVIESAQENWPEAVPHDRALQDSLGRIRDAVARKLTMRYEVGTFLIVEFEDTHIHSESDRIAIDQYARSIVVPLAQKATFGALYLVSDRKRLAFGYEI